MKLKMISCIFTIRLVPSEFSCKRMRFFSPREAIISILWFLRVLLCKQKDDTVQITKYPNVTLIEAQRNALNLRPTLNCRIDTKQIGSHKAQLLYCKTNPLLFTKKKINFVIHSFLCQREAESLGQPTTPLFSELGLRSNLLAGGRMSPPPPTHTHTHTYCLSVFTFGNILRLVFHMRR